MAARGGSFRPWYTLRTLAQPTCRQWQIYQSGVAISKWLRSPGNMVPDMGRLNLWVRTHLSFGFRPVAMSPAPPSILFGRNECRGTLPVETPPQLLLVISNEPGTAPLISVDLPGCAGDECSLGFTWLSGPQFVT